MKRVSIFASLVLLAGIGLAQRYRMQREDGPRPSFASSAEFHFIRVEYTDLPQYHRRFGYASRAGTGEGWWMVDWPDAEDPAGVSKDGVPHWAARAWAELVPAHRCDIVG